MLSLPAPACALAMRLLRAGHVVVACAGCGRALAADVDHDGSRLPGCTRRYCTEDCRDGEEARRAAPARRYRAVHADLLARHQLEDAGQLSVVDQPLPPLPREVTQ